MGSVCRTILERRGRYPFDLMLFCSCRVACFARRFAAWRLQVVCSWKLAKVYGWMRKVGIGHFEIVSDVPLPRASMKLRFDGIGHFEIVSNLPLPRKAASA